MRIIVTDLTGRTIEELWNSKTTTGDHTVNFDASHIASGTYYYELIAESTHLMKMAQGFSWRMIHSCSPMPLG